MRDEAHRFAIAFYRQTHRQKSIKSQLDEITGIGPKTKKKLLQKFSSVEGIRRATDAELINTVGQKMSEVIKENLS
jgi:excinuclease ABC subunit C